MAVRFYFGCIAVCLASGGIPVSDRPANAQETQSSAAISGQTPLAMTLRGWLADGTPVETQLERNGHFSDGRSLRDFKRLTHHSGSFDSPGLTPVRLLTLATGEQIPIRQRKDFSFSVDFDRSGQATPMTVLLAGQPVQVPGGAVRSVSVPASVRDVAISGNPMSDDFWSRRDGGSLRVELPTGGSVLVPRNGSLRRDFHPPVRPSQVELTVAWPEGGSGSIDFLFAQPGDYPSGGDNAAASSNADVGAETGLRLSLERDRIAVRRIGAIRVSLDAMSVPRSSLLKSVPQVSRIRLAVDRGLTLSLAGRVLARGSRSLGGLRSIVVRSGNVSEPSAAEPASTPIGHTVSLNEGGAPVLLNCVVQAREAGSLKTSSGVDAGGRIAVLTHDGDVFYGNRVTMRPRNVDLTTQFGPVSLSGTKVRSVKFPRSVPRELSSVIGDICRVELAQDSSTDFFGPQPTCELTGTVRLTENAVEIQHPLLNRVSPGDPDATSQSLVTLPWESVREIEPLFHGEYRLLDPGPRHLGNSILRSFTQPEPDGTTLTLQFPLADVPAGPVYVSVEAAELNPASPDTLRATPGLAELRSGFLTTVVVLNDVQAGSLNQHCEFHSPIGRPVRLRIPLPRDALKSGLNILELRQNPSRDDSRVFDECELWRIAIEIES